MQTFYRIQDILSVALTGTRRCERPDPADPSGYYAAAEALAAGRDLYSAEWLRGTLVAAGIDLRAPDLGRAAAHARQVEESDTAGGIRIVRRAVQ